MKKNFLFALPFVALILAGCGSKPAQEEETKTTDSGEVTPSEDETTTQEKVAPHGPEGSELISWYLVGDGSFVNGEATWSIETGAQFYSNPASETDLGCLLGIALTEGDLFKFSDGTAWHGYDKIDTYESDNNRGTKSFEGVDDGFGGKNFRCKETNVYDIYVNGDAVLWIQYAQ